MTVKNSNTKTVKKNGKCFINSARFYVSTNPLGYYLVHGIVVNALDNKPMGHAWLENELFVVDCAFEEPRIFNKDRYYEIGKVSETVRYDYQSTLERLHESNHYGPWDIEVPR